MLCRRFGGPLRSSVSGSSTTLADLGVTHTLRRRALGALSTMSRPYSSSGMVDALVRAPLVRGLPTCIEASQDM